MQLTSLPTRARGAAASRPKPAPRRGPRALGRARQRRAPRDLRHFDDRAARRGWRSSTSARGAWRTPRSQRASAWAIRSGTSSRPCCSGARTCCSSGPPGSGKSFLLKVLKDRMRAPLVTASTGAAADKIGAVTLHSALGLGSGTARQEIVASCKSRASTGGRLPNRARLRPLIVDEVSHAHGQAAGPGARGLAMLRADLPQFVVSGDPMQLGAVGAEKDGAFHDSGLVKRLRPYVLAESFRQAEDSTFLRILNRARLGKRARAPTWLVATRAERWPRGRAARSSAATSRWRVQQTQACRGMRDCTSTGTPDAGDVPAVPTSVWRRNTLHLKPGARVLLNRNLPEYPSLHNGSCGTVTSLAPCRRSCDFDAGDPCAIKSSRRSTRRTQGRGHAHVHAARCSRGR